MVGFLGNFISLVGEFLLMVFFFYEDFCGILLGWFLLRFLVGYYLFLVFFLFVGRCFLSFYVDNNYYLFLDIYSYFGLIVVVRCGFMYFNYVYRVVLNLFLFYQFQVYFYGVFEIDFDLQLYFGMKVGEKGYYCGFDIFFLLNIDFVSSKFNVVFVGYEGGFEIFIVGKWEVEIVVNLKGLCGGVYYVKIFFWMLYELDFFLLVVVVIYGLNLFVFVFVINVEGDYDVVFVERLEVMINIMSFDLFLRESVMGSCLVFGFVEFYYIFVEVYFFKIGCLVSVFFEVLKVFFKMFIISVVFKVFFFIGVFYIYVEGGSIVVLLGVIGECWIYWQVFVVVDQLLYFRCYGKVWMIFQQLFKGEFG